MNWNKAVYDNTGITLVCPKTKRLCQITSNGVVYILIRQESPNKPLQPQYFGLLNKAKEAGEKFVNTGEYF